MRFFVDGWDPAYGSSVDDVDVVPDQSNAPVTDDVEADAADWAPVPPVAWLDEPEAVIFVDGVRRIDARVWIPDDEGSAALGVAASYAAGATCCCASGAHVQSARTARGLFTGDPHATDARTDVGTFTAHHAALDPSEPPAMALSAALQSSLQTLEIAVAVQARDDAVAHGLTAGTDLLVIDGPLRGREQLPRTLGFIKSHRALYLSPSQNQVVAALGAGERSPVFLLGRRWHRYAWYLRLPCRPGAPWAGVVRVECAATLTAGEAIELATLSQSVLPRFASIEYKDQRAPQNLVPIAGLERELRRRLGDQRFVFRALQAAAG